MMAQSMFGSMYDAKKAGMDDLRDSAYKTGSLGGRGAIIEAATLGGGMLGRGASRAFGGLPQAEAKQAKIQELMQLHPNPKSYEDFMAVANDLKNAGLMAEYEKAFEMADKMNDTKSTGDPYLLAKRKRNEKAVELQQAYGPMESLADKKAFKRQLIESGVGDSTVFTSITNEINTLTAAGIAQDKDTDTRQEKLSTQMIKNGVPEIESALVEFEGLAAKYKNNLPGIGIDKWLLTKDAKDMKTAFSQVRNMVLKERSGAAVTNPEFERLKEEIEGAMYTTDDDAIRWISRVRSTLERVKGTIFAGYGDRVKKSYWDTGTGVKMYKAPERKDMGIKIGDIRNGHKFLGGDPKDSKSWEKQ